MPFSFTVQFPFLALKLHRHHHHFLSRPFVSFPPKPLHVISPPPSKAIGRYGKYYPNPSDDDPPKAAEDSAHGISKSQKIHRQASKARKRQEDDFKAQQSTYLSSIADVQDPSINSIDLSNSQDDFFGEIDKAVAMKRHELVKKGLMKPKKQEDEFVNKGSFGFSEDGQGKN